MTKAKRKGNLPALVVEKPVAPWAAKPKGERLSDVVDRGLEQIRRVLDKDLDLDDDSPAALKRLTNTTNAALTVLSLQMRLDEAELRTRGTSAYEQRILTELMDNFDREEAEQARAEQHLTGTRGTR